MCSLFGFLDYQGIMPHRILRKLTQSLAKLLRKEEQMQLVSATFVTVKSLFTRDRNLLTSFISPRRKEQERLWGILV